MICPWTIVYPKSHAIKIFFADEGECDIFIYDYNHICQSYHHNILNRWDWISSHLHLIKISSAGEGGCDLQTSKQASQQGRHQSLSRRQQPQVFYCQSFCQQYNPVSSNNNNSYGHPSALERLGDFLLLYQITKNVNPLIIKDIFEVMVMIMTVVLIKGIFYAMVIMWMSKNEDDEMRIIW